jgi:hypothetical protein
VPDTGASVRLRQAVLVARDLEPAVAALTSALDLREPYRDPGVGMFGLANAVFALGDCFLEVVSPLQPGTAAGRYLERRGGDGGYMVMFDLEDLDGARGRLAELGVRVVWQVDLPDISGTHLHPLDMQGAIVSLDCSRPFGTWRWGGPQWTGRTGEGAAARLAGVKLAVADPGGAAARWGEVLGITPQAAAGDDDGVWLATDGGEVHFGRAATRQREGLSEVWLELPEPLRAGRDSLELHGVTLRLLAPGSVTGGSPQRLPAGT